jgi:hypothetical protein
MTVESCATANFMNEQAMIGDGLIRRTKTLEPTAACMSSKYV